MSISVKTPKTPKTPKTLQFWTLITLLTLWLPSLAFAQASHEGYIVTFNIPSQTLPGALNAFARQAKVELVFAERGFEDVQTEPVIGTYRRERALELLLAGTGLSVGYGSGDSVIVQRADKSEQTGDVRLGDEEASMVLLAQAAVDESRRAVSDAGTYTALDEQSTESSNRRRAEESSQALEEITVTGSRIRGAQSASPVVTIDRAEIDLAGLATVEEVVEYLPQNFGAGASLDAATNPENARQAVGGDVRSLGGGTSVNLRGLGASSTLVLLNGRRMSPSGFEARFTNISSIPVTAIDRVEVMTDGASAIYGSDAIAGVINFILRDDYEGAETRIRYGSDVSGGTWNTQFGQSFGTSWNDGNVLLSYEYYESEPLANSDRSFTASNDLTPFGGTDWRQPGGNPANIRIGGFTGDYYAIPADQDGTSLTAADFDINTPRNLRNAFEFTDILPALERHSAFLSLSQELSAVQLFASARFSTEDNLQRAARTPIDLNVPGDDPSTPDVVEGNPFFVDPTGTGLTSVRVDNYALEQDFGPRLAYGEIDSTGTTMGVRFDVSNNWRAELLGNWSKEEVVSGFRNAVSRAAIRAAVNQTDPSLAFNPFGDGSNTNPAVLDTLFAPADSPNNNFNESTNELWSISLNIDGELLDLPGGALQIATGLDLRDEALDTTNTVGGITSLSRDIFAVYAELFMPIVGEQNSRTGFQRFEVSIAARYEDYSDFGNSTNPKLGFLWSLTESLNIRGTIGTSYRAPALVDLDESTSASFYWALPDLGVAPYNFLLLFGRNSNLQPEEATTWTAGFQWRPSRPNGLSLDMTYFNVDFDGRIEVPTLDVFGAQNDPRFASLITLNPSSDQIAAIIDSPLYNPEGGAGFGFGPFPDDDLISGTVPIGAIFDGRLTNLARSVVTGLEAQVSYSADTRLGSFSVGFSGSYLFDFERKFIETDPLVEELDTLGRPVDFRARGNASWSRDDWVIATFLNYTDGYTDQFSEPERSVSSWTTVDVTVAYSFDGDAPLLGNTRLSLSTQNLFDEDPPFVDTAGGLAYDVTNANPLGRMFALQVTKEW